MDNGKYSIFDISNWFLKKLNVSHKRLQKLCYYAVAWYYTLKEERLINDDDFVAWEHGPVSPVLFQQYKGSGIKTVEPTVFGSPITDPEDIDFLESVWETYKELGPGALEALTHTEDPWIKARRKGDNEKISYKDMAEYYQSIYIANEEDNA